MPLTRPKAHQLSGQSAKSSVRVVTTSNVTLSGGAPATVDGVSLTLEDRILVTGQTNATENGIYRVTTVGSGSNGTWVRGRDANQNEEVLAGMTTMVSEGTTYADTFWKLTTDGAVTLGTTELVFAQHSSGGGGSGITYTAQASAPSSPSVGDKWYDTGDDILFEYTNDGTSNVWVDISSASTGDSTTGDYAITGNLTAGGNVATGNVTVTDSTITATGNITGGNITGSNLISSGSISAGGNYLSSQPSFRNLIINGDMQIAQRATSATGKTSSGYYTCDRWYQGFSSAGTWTFTQDTNVPTGQGFTSSLKMQCTTANASLSASASFQLHARLEGQHLQHLKKGTANAESLTLSFWVKSNKTGTYQVNLDDKDNTRIIGKTFAIDTADTWEKKTLTFVGDTVGAFNNDNNESFRVVWWFASGSNYNTGSVPTSWETLDVTDIAAGLTVNLADSTSNYINITGVQLEVGSQATPFEHRPYDVELQRCYRYFQKIPNYILNSYATTGATGRPHRVTMRSAPTAYWSENGTAYQVYRISDGARSGSLTSSSAPTNIYHLYYIYNPVSAWACASGSHNAVLTDMELSAEL